jgi:hypothetical protein
MIAVSKCKTLLDLATLWGMQVQYHAILAQVAAAATAAAATAATTAAATAATAAVNSAETVTTAAVASTNEPSHRYAIIFNVQLHQLALRSTLQVVVACSYACLCNLEYHTHALSIQCEELVVHL